MELSSKEQGFVKFAATRCHLSVFTGAIFVLISLIAIILIQNKPYDFVRVIAPQFKETQTRLITRKKTLEKAMSSYRNKSERELAGELIGIYEFNIKESFIVLIGFAYFLFLVMFTVGWFLLLHGYGTKKWMNILNKILVKKN